jgi:hypothetical protein
MFAKPQSESEVSNMKAAALRVIVLLVITSLLQGNVTAQDGKSSESSASTNEVDVLKRRVEELERQNRMMMQTLAELKAKLGGTAISLAPAGLSNAQRSPSDSALDGTPIASQRATANSPQRTLHTPTASQAAAGASAQTGANENKAKDDSVRWSELIGEGNRIKFYGLLRLDVDIDSQRPNNGQTPLFITSEAPGGNNLETGSFSMHPRLTRFGIDYAGPRIAKLGDGALGGKLETDFENGGSESRQIIRIRHAYLTLKWNQLTVLGGQTWDLVSPLFPTVNNDTLMWNAGNVGDRRPQFRVSYDPKVGQGQWSFAGAAGLMGAVDLQDLDANGFRDGEESGRPNVQARIGYSHQLWVKDQRASFGVSGFYGWLNTSRSIAGRTNFHSQLINMDYTAPLASRLSLRGEGWWGRNLSDTRGGAGQGINLATGQEIRSRGGWSELALKASRYWSIHPGFTMDDPVDRDLSAGSRTRNRAFYLGNRITPGGNFLIGIDYLRWKTNFKGLLRGLDNRVNIFFQYGF